MSFLPKISASVYDAKAAAAAQFVNPSEFVLQHCEQIGEHVVALVVYPSCKNYEGRKVIVFANTTPDHLRVCQRIDPHFVTDAPAGTHVPVARFEPTPRGWKLAKICAMAL